MRRAARPGKCARSRAAVRAARAGRQRAADDIATCFHEAGHAVAQLETGTAFERIVLNGDGSTPYETSYGEKKFVKGLIEGNDVISLVDIEAFRSGMLPDNLILGALAAAEKFIFHLASGPAAEAKHLFTCVGDVLDGYNAKGGDYHAMLAVARLMLDDVVLADRWIGLVLRWAERLIERRWREVGVLAQSLYDMRVLEYQDVLSTLGLSKRALATYATHKPIVLDGRRRFRLIGLRVGRGMRNHSATRPIWE